MVQLRLTLEKMSKRRLESYSESGSWDLLGDPPGGNRGTRGAKIGIVNKRKSGLALERGRIKPIGQYRVL